MHRVDQSKAEPLKPSDTPETDKELHAIWYGGSRYSFPDHARRMERERDQARKALDDVWSYLSEWEKGSEDRSRTALTVEDRSHSEGGCCAARIAKHKMVSLGYKPHKGQAEERKGADVMKPLVRRFHWHCDDCRLSGHVDIKLPDQVRHLHGLLEGDHARKRGPVRCPSDYFHITNVSMPNESSQP